MRSQSLQVEFGATNIPFELCFADRKTLAIEVNPDRSVVVVAPNGTAQADVFQRVKKKAPWIRKQQNHFAQYLPTESPRKFVSGETHRYLGRKYLLKTFKLDSKTLKLSRGLMNMYLPEPRNSDAIKRVLELWYRERASVVFRELLRLSSERLSHERLVPPEMQIRRMKSRWGSCTKTGRILLNIELIKAPKRCIEYVILHELCHLIEFNHSSGFYRLLTRVMPDWPDRKQKLDRVFVV